MDHSEIVHITLNVCTHHLVELEQKTTLCGVAANCKSVKVSTNFSNTFFTAIKQLLPPVNSAY